MKKIKVFLDSNVFIAGVASTTGASAVVLRLTKTRVVDSYISQQILDESERNLKKKLPKFLPYFYYALKHLPFTIVKDSINIDKKLSKHFPKRSDQQIFETVQKLKPDYFLTLNRKHFHQDAIQKIANFKIKIPAQFLDEWETL
ncbi:MAG: hypothetical protein US31_C0001G0072 [Berkelbacteria bacterium GW2011_GWA1_36_9]|uniref:PIN domain-containing protein n=1 Tax=Berkelbacteria bacterium GW2011_GWA1_36_9 TaxID=1618331 RepID=A0A0G0FYM5_9BACT|nr:MAG: hypothetical protein US31_C0001G0072 [Berkelbacteria bacterium GW2011_GWA1_36_9]